MAGGDDIAAERIERLDALASAAARAGEDERARQYVRRARRIAEVHRIDLPRTFKRSTCDACDRYQVVGETVRVRLRDGHVVRTCACGAQARYPYR